MGNWQVNRFYDLITKAISNWMELFVLIFPCNIFTKVLVIYLKLLNAFVGIGQSSPTLYSKWSDWIVMTSTELSRSKETFADIHDLTTSQNVNLVNSPWQFHGVWTWRILLDNFMECELGKFSLTTSWSAGMSWRRYKCIWPFLVACGSFSLWHFLNWRWTISR